MANKNKMREENTEGNFFVESSCINCGTCYWVAPNVFREANGYSAVYEQPKTKTTNAYRALLSCPVDAIGVSEKLPDFFEVAKNMPYEIEGGVYHTGFHAKSSYGAASYFIKGDWGNILIDSPRFIGQLAKKIEKMGGIDLQLLTHKDDVADTDKYWEQFRGIRHIHRDDVSRKTSHYEVQYEGNEIIDLHKDLKVIPVPGHTKGSVCFLYKNKFLFTGDHLAFSPDLGHLFAFKNACWYDFKIQTESMERLLNFNFEYVLPGHGAPFKASAPEMKESLRKCISWMKS